MLNCPTCGSNKGVHFHASRRYVSTPNGIEVKTVGASHISCVLCKIKVSVDKLSRTKEFGKVTA